MAASIQEAVELTQKAFDSADRYRNPVMVLGDGCIGQMMEPVAMPEYKKPDDLGEKTWAATGYHEGCGRERNIINSLYIEPDRCEKHNLDLQAKYDRMRENEVLVKEEMTEDADIVVVAYGTTARIALTAVRKAREKGIKAGLIRPITVWPFPEKAVAAAAERCKAFLTVEMSLGQMVDDVRLAVNGKRPVSFFGRTGGMIPGVGEILGEIEKIGKEL